MKLKPFLYTIIPILLFSSLIFSSCEKEKDKEPPHDKKAVIFASHLRFDGETVYEGDVLTFKNGYDMNIRLFRFYLSNIQLTSADGEVVDVSSVELLTPGSRLDDNLFSADIDKKQYTSIQFGLGVDPQQNDSDPKSFPIQHPLSTWNNMYWSMLKYRFAKFEAKVNESGMLGENDILVTLHPGTNELYRTVSLPIELDLRGTGKKGVNISIDMDTLFAGSNPFDWNTEHSTHSEGAKELAIAAKFMDNLKSAISIQVIADETGIE